MTLPAEAEDRDAELANILAQLTNRTNEHRPTLEQLTAAHPHLAVELRALWGTALLVDAVASHSTSEPNALASGDGIISVESESPEAGRPLHGARDSERRTNLQPPSVLGDFELLEELGRGGMGVVYRARQRSLGREVAVKLILQGAQASATEKARFQAEVTAAAHLEHPNIVPIYEVGEVDGWPFFVMKLIDGETLAHRIAKNPMSEREAVQCLLRVARAIEYAHGRSVVHRDLKPANILIDPAGAPHVTDFGLAKRITADVSSLTQSGSILGTPAYMAPEQAAGSRGKVGTLSDVYSLGAILYAMLTGRAPFQGTSPVDTVLMVLEQDPPPPRLLNAHVSRDLEMIVLKCLQKPLDLRYPSAAALADDLQAYLAGESIAARSGRFTDVMARVFRESHHATVLENWGVLWMWHSAVLLVICLLTNWMNLKRDVWPAMGEAWPYLVLWGGGLAIWAPIFWALRHRAGPVTAVERQIAHAWGGSIISVMLLFWVEDLLDLPVLTLSPVLGLIGGMVFVMKAGILAGGFYIQSAAMFAVAIAMAEMRRRGCEYGISVYGIVAAGTFFFPGWKYYRQGRGKIPDA